MSRKQDKPLPAPPPFQRDPPPPPPPERPPPIPPESRHSWLPSDSQKSGETLCSKESSFADSSRLGSEHPLQQGLCAPSHPNGRPLSCPSAGFVRAHHRTEGAGTSESSKVGARDRVKVVALVMVHEEGLENVFRRLFSMTFSNELRWTLGNKPKVI